MMILFMIYVSNAVFVLPTNYPCKCNQLLNAQDCKNQQCLWSSSGCSYPVCTTLPVTSCDTSANCSLTNDGVCAQFTGFCPDYNVLVASQCAIKHPSCGPNSTPNGYPNITCVTQPYPTSCSLLIQSTCTPAYCKWNGQSCTDKQCQDYTTAKCTVAYISLKRAYNLCVVTGGSCQDAPDVSSLNGGNCNSISQNSYTWNSTACVRCNNDTFTVYTLPASYAVILIFISYYMI